MRLTHPVKIAPKLSQATKNPKNIRKTTNGLLSIALKRNFILNFECSLVKIICPFQVGLVNLEAN